jgi:hypothetical protein
MAPVNVSAPPEPLTVIVSVPEVQVGKVQPDRSAEPPESTLTTIALVEAVPVTATVEAIFPEPNWLALKVAVAVPDVLTKAMASTLRKPLMPSEAAALRSTLVPAPTSPTCRMSFEAPPLYRSPDVTWLDAPTTNRSIRLLATMSSSPVDPVIVIASVPEDQVAKVQPDISSEPPADRLSTSACVDAVPVKVTLLEILPAPNWPALNVAVDVPDVLVKLTASTLRKPFTPSVAAALKSMVTPPPAAPTCRMSLPVPPS